MPDYSGPLVHDPVEQEETECTGGWQCSAARASVFTAICLGSRVKLTRRKMTPTRLETPGVVEGDCYGASTLDGAIVLMIRLDDGECVGVNVSSPQEWAWEVS